MSLSAFSSDDKKTLAQQFANLHDAIDYEGQPWSDQQFWHHTADHHLFLALASEFTYISKLGGSSYLMVGVVEIEGQTFLEWQNNGPLTFDLSGSWQDLVMVRAFRWVILNGGTFMIGDPRFAAEDNNPRSQLSSHASLSRKGKIRLQCRYCRQSLAFNQTCSSCPPRTQHPLGFHLMTALPCDFQQGHALVKFLHDQYFCYCDDSMQYLGCSLDAKTGEFTCFETRGLARSLLQQAIPQPNSNKFLQVRTVPNASVTCESALVYNQQGVLRYSLPPSFQVRQPGQPGIVVVQLLHKFTWPTIKKLWRDINAVMLQVDGCNLWVREGQLPTTFHLTPQIKLIYRLWQALVQIIRSQQPINYQAALIVETKTETKTLCRMVAPHYFLLNYQALPSQSCLNFQTLVGTLADCAWHLWSKLQPQAQLKLLFTQLGTLHEQAQQWWQELTLETVASPPATLPPAQLSLRKLPGRRSCSVGSYMDCQRSLVT